ncbi:methylmalonyl-CoA epimerase [Desulfitibacter alkalitolerans]|uniref:methylmalonyl-CoA epimerase n=1 Tax=Desulfitibacter alkalitolerans TaxID=264641 RepID=UPI00048594D5|nr:methylmalonyl-CoA epimerase [Desulfitibacter alkalitolerans]
MISKIDHIGIAVSNIDEAKKLYEEVFGLEVSGIEVVEEQKVKVAFIPTGNSKIELLESTDPEGPVAKYLAKRGEGIQHMALRVTNIKEALEEVKFKGIRVIDEKPRYGAGGAKIAFLHPKDTNGVLIELCERE